MTRPPKMPVQEALERLPGWSQAPGRAAIRRGYRFDGFAQAMAFMSRCALAAQRLDHHPEWCNVYDRVEVVLTTHDVGGVTALDVELARIMDEAACDLR